jgi:predicted nucleotidyltransferase
MQPSAATTPITWEADGLDVSQCQMALVPSTMARMGKATVPFTFDVDLVVAVCQRHGVSRVGVFGSFARGDGTPESDLDLLVEFSDRTGLLEVVALERELVAALGRKVDLLTEAAISPYIRDRILHDLHLLYEAEQK